VLRHYPDTDRLEIEGARLHAVGADGRVTRASARRALANADGSEVQLIGGAQVVAELAPNDHLEVQSEFLHAFVRTERVKTHLPVVVRRGEAVTRAAGLEYDHLQRELKLVGAVRANLPPTQVRPGAS
jgi:lipopolysaccharide export system protein LptC